MVVAPLLLVLLQEPRLRQGCRLLLLLRQQQAVQRVRRAGSTGTMGSQDLGRARHPLRSEFRGNRLCCRGWLHKATTRLSAGCCPFTTSACKLPPRLVPLQCGGTADPKDIHAAQGEVIKMTTASAT